jgi:AcrR family transcriptional regulator
MNSAQTARTTPDEQSALLTAEPTPSIEEARQARLAEGGLRERKKRATRDALSLAALRLALDRGLGNVRVEEIAAEAGVSPRTFNNYFASKEEAIVSRETARAEQTAAALIARPADEPLGEALIRVFAELYAVARQMSPDRKARIQLIMSSRLLQAEWLLQLARDERLLVEAIAKRTGTDPERDLYPKVLAAQISGAIRAARAQWMASSDSASLADVTIQAITQVVEGVIS